MKNSKRSTSFSTFSACIILFLFVGACTPQYAVRGNMIDDDLLVDIVPGEIHAREVAEILGTPTSFSSFGGESWYYVSERVESFLFFEPEILEREIVEIKFETSGLVQTISKKDSPTLRNVAFVDRTTPTAGNEITFFEQIFGNLGRFNNE